VPARIRGSENYPLLSLLLRGRRKKEHELYRSRIEREQRLLHELRGGFSDKFAA
jgi:hypothetical protein